MPTSPSIALHHGHEQQDTYLVLDDFGARLGRSWCETNEDAADRETLIRDLMAGQYNNPIRVVAFNAAEGWSRDRQGGAAEAVSGLNVPLVVARPHNQVPP